MLALLETLSAAQMATQEANASLPDGAQPIQDPEHTAQWIPARETISDQELERWARVDQDQPVDEAFQRGIYPVGHGRGKRPDDLEPAYVRARFRRHEFRDSVNGVYPIPFASLLRLPQLRGDGVLWGHVATFGAEPALLAHISGADSPSATLQRISAIEGRPAASSAKPMDRPSKVEWTMLGYVDTPPGQIAPTTLQRRQVAAIEVKELFNIGCSSQQREKVMPHVADDIRQAVAQARRLNPRAGIPEGLASKMIGNGSTLQEAKAALFEHAAEIGRAA